MSGRTQTADHIAACSVAKGGDCAGVCDTGIAGLKILRDTQKAEQT
jgi:hypothetical protein